MVFANFNCTPNVFHFFCLLDHQSLIRRLPVRLLFGTNVLIFLGVEMLSVFLAWPRQSCRPHNTLVMANNSVSLCCSAFSFPNDDSEQFGQVLVVMHTECRILALLTVHSLFGDQKPTSSSEDDKQFPLPLFCFRSLRIRLSGTGGNIGTTNVESNFFHKSYPHRYQSKRQWTVNLICFHCDLTPRITVQNRATKYDAPRPQISDWHKSEAKVCAV